MERRSRKTLRSAALIGCALAVMILLGAIAVRSSGLHVGANDAVQERVVINADEIQIRQLERAWNQAEASQQVQEVSSLMADTLVYTDYDGSFMHKAEYMKWVAAPQQKADHIYDEGLAVQVYGDAAVATGIYRETGTNKGKAYVIRSRFTDTWIKKDGMWRCVASQNTLLPK